MLNKDKIKKILLVCLFIILSFVFYFLNISNEKEDTPEKEKTIAQTQPLEKKFINPEDLDDYVMKAFLQELLGTDYTLLINLFAPDKLDQNIDHMTDKEISDYAKGVGEKIKDHKELVKARVLSVQEDVEKETEYQIELEFRDTSKKIITITTNESKIITPIQQLY